MTTIRWDNGDGALDKGEIPAINSQLHAKLNVVFIAKPGGTLAKSVIAGYCPGAGAKCVFIFANAFTAVNDNVHPLIRDVSDTCAHEVGHALGISTRHADDRDLTKAGHDSDQYPMDVRYNNLYNGKDRMAFTLGGPIMQSPRYGHSLWMRYEDWTAANLGGKSYP